MSFANVVNPSVNRNRFFYGSPYQDIAQTYLPVTMRELYQYTKYYYRTNPIIAPIIDKMAEYPITNFVVEQSDGRLHENILEFVNNELQLREFMIGMGKDSGVFGNSYASVIYPFHRFLVCKQCKSRQNIETTNRWKYTGNNWMAWCKKCKVQARHDIQDVWVRDKNKIKIHRWPVQQVDIQFNPFTGDCKYFYRISARERKMVESGVKLYVAKTPKVFLDAVRERKDVELDPQNLFHFRNTSIADENLAYGMPIMYPALKEAFHWQVLRKANEAISFQYILPLTILFPQPHGEMNPFTHMKLKDWKKFVEQQLARWKKDPNHVSIMPIPMGSQQVFGNARALMVTPEMKQTEESIIAACQVPREFVQGGLSYSGTSVSLRMLENHFLVYREQVSRFLKWISERIYLYMQWPKFSLGLSDFKMADDVQQKQIMMQLMEMKKVSESHILEDAGLNPESEYKNIMKEIDRGGEIAKKQQLQAAEAQGEAMKIQMKYEAEAQMEQQQHMMKLQAESMSSDERSALLDEIDRGQMTGFAPFDPVQLAIQSLDMLKMMPKDRRMPHLQRLQQDSPELLGIMNQVASARRGFPQQQPMPEQKPPRRGPGTSEM